MPRWPRESNTPCCLGRFRSVRSSHSARKLLEPRPDYENYTNSQFDKARAQQPLGFVADNRKHADYNTTVNSWIEQRAFVDHAPLLLEKEYPELAANVSAALAALKAVKPPSPAGLIAVEALDAPFTCGAGTGSGGLAIEIQIGPHGGLVSLKRGKRQWAGPNNPVGQYLYETFTEADYGPFLHDLGSRIGDEGVWPHHTAGPYANNTRACKDDCSFCKANITAAHAKRRSIHPNVTHIWTGMIGDDCVVLVKGTLPSEAHDEAGAPTDVVTKLTVSPSTSTLDWDVVQVNKRPTRLPEATFFTFNPAVPDPRGWGLTVLGWNAGL